MAQRLEGPRLRDHLRSWLARVEFDKNSRELTLAIRRIPAASGFPPSYLPARRARHRRGGGKGVVGAVTTTPVAASPAALQDNGAPRAGAQDLTFVDIGSTWLKIAVLVAYYRAWLGTPVEMAGLSVAVEIANAFHCVPFVDDEGWADHVRRFGLPVVMTDRARNPTRRTRGYDFDNNDDVWWRI